MEKDNRLFQPERAARLFRQQGNKPYTDGELERVLRNTKTGKRLARAEQSNAAAVGVKR